MKEKIISFLKYAIGLLLGGGMLWFVFRGVSWSELEGNLQQIQWIWLVFALLVGFASHFLRALRWRMQLQASGYETQLGTTFAAVMITYLVNLVIPRAGEVARCSVLLRTDKVPITVSAGTVFTERVIDVIALALWLLLGFFIANKEIMDFLQKAIAAKSSGESSPLIPIVLGVGVLGVALFFAFRKKLMQIPIFQKIMNIAEEMLKGALSIRNLAQPMLFILYTVLIWAAYWIAVWLIMQSLQSIIQPPQGVSSLAFAFMLTLIGTLGVLVPSPGATGPYHATVLLTFVLFHLCEDAAHCLLGQTAALTLHFVQMIVVPVVGGLLSYLYLLTKEAKTN